MSALLIETNGSRGVGDGVVDDDDDGVVDDDDGDDRDDDDDDDGVVWCGVVWWQTFVAFTNETPVVDVEYLTVSRYYPSLNSARSETLQRVGTAENAVSQAPPQTPRVGILIIPRAPFINTDGRETMTSQSQEGKGQNNHSLHASTAAASARRLLCRVGQKGGVGAF
jgi:hypothetical protein